MHPNSVQHNCTNETVTISFTRRFEIASTPVRSFGWNPTHLVQFFARSGALPVERPRQASPLVFHDPFSNED